MKNAGLNAVLSLSLGLFSPLAKSSEPPVDIKPVSPSIARPPEHDVKFDEADFNAKSWLRDFEFVIVVNRATSGVEAQTVQIYRNAKPVTVTDVMEFETRLNDIEADSKTHGERERRIRELTTKTKNSETLFKVSTGRNQFEKKGEHHSQKDSWTVTPTGYYTPQELRPRHKSESYSSSLCESFAGKLVSAFTRKTLCTYMENVVFFNGGIALHKAIPGTEPVLGQKASGGCVRLPAALAEFLYLSIGSTQIPALTRTPVVNRDGSVATGNDGGILYSETTKSSWGRKYVWSALIVVQDKIVP